MLVNNILLQNTLKQTNILYSYSENKGFIKLLNRIYGASSVSLLDDSIFAHQSVDLIICNNRIDILDMCIDLCHYFHCPLLVVDHKSKPFNVQIDNKHKIPITNRQVAINQNIAKSWGNKIFDEIIETDIANTNNVSSWKNLIDDISNNTFKVIIEQDQNSI